MTREQEKEEKYTSEHFESLLAQLTMDQLRFVVARQSCATDKDAAEAIGISAQTVYRWPDVVKEAAHMMALDGVVAARHVLKRNLTKAMLVKVAGLDLNDDRLRQAVATEIIEWMLGKAKQTTEHTGAGGGPLVHEHKISIYEYDDDSDEDAEG